MKPKTKLQKKIAQLSKELPDLNKDQLAYAREELFKHKATLLKSGRLTCLDCAHQWKTAESNISNVILGVTCPKCKRKLEVEQTRKRVFADEIYYQVIQTYKGYQVSRMFKVFKRWKAGEKQRFFIQKLFDNWYTKDGKVEVVGYYKTSLWNDSWGGGYELRSSRSSTDYTFGLKKKYVYPKMKFIPVLKRNGLKTSIHGITAHFLFIDLLTNPKIETLFKAKQYSLVEHRDDIDKYWPSIKICLRHNYKIKDARMYFDYIEYLKYFNKDVRNPFYACPKDLHKEHDRYMDKKNKAEAERKLQERLAKIKEEEDAYKERCGKYMGLSFKKDNIEVSFINSVRQLAKESLTLHHCAYSSRYHKRENILMFSVRVDGKVKATGAVNIDRKNVAELRGQNNWQSEHNTPENRLIGKKATALLQDNMVTILNGHKPKRKVRKKRKVQLQIAS